LPKKKEDKKKKKLEELAKKATHQNLKEKRVKMSTGYNWSARGIQNNNALKWQG